MKIIINGAPTEVSDDLALTSLLKNLNLNEKTTIVELNGEVLQKGTYGEVILREDDKLELVRLVGGG